MTSLYGDKSKVKVKVIMGYFMFIEYQLLRWKKNGKRN